MGFYGNISGSTKSAFTFDKVYANRATMDTSLENGNDNVFLGRYVLIEYDDAPVSIWIVIRDGVMRAYSDYELTTILTPMANVVYRDENSAQTAHSTVDFYTYDVAQRKLVKLSGTQAPYQINYNIDVQKYGRGYDGTVWRKVYDPDLNKYRYVLLAELNAAVPTFHSIVTNPLEISDAPSIDETDSTNLNYYIKQRGYIADRFKPDASGDVTVAQPQEAWEYNPDGSEKSHTWNIGEQTVHIKFNKAGFAPQTHQTALETDNVQGTNIIQWQPASTGRHYNVSLANPQGTTAQDVREWCIDLPVLGNVIHKMYDLIYGYTGTSRRISNWWKTSLSQSDRMYDMKTMVGAMNRVRDILGYNVGAITATPEVVKSVEDNNLYFKGPDVINDGGITGIYYYAKQPRYTQDPTGEFCIIDGEYRVANPITTAPANRYSVDHYDYVPTELTDVKSSMYGLVVALNRLMGTGTSPGTVRDSNTVIGLMGRMTDLLGRVDVALVPNRFIYTDGYGIMRTTGTLNDLVGMFPFTPGTINNGIFTAAATDNGNEYIMDGKGNWRYPVSYKLTDLTPIAANNSRLRDPVIAADTLNSAISRLEHELAEIYGVSSAADLASITGVKGTTGGTGIDDFTRVAQILNNRTETIDERITDLRMWRYISVANNEEHLSSVVTDITAAAGTADSENNADTFLFKSGNKWIMLALDSTNDKLTIGHKISNNVTPNTWITPSTQGWGAEGDLDNEIIIPKFKVDEAGHVIQHSTETYYLPNSFKRINIAVQSTAVAQSTGNTTQIVADTSADTLTLATANKWLTIANDATNDKITFGHITAWNAQQAITPSVADGWKTSASATDKDNKITLPTFTFDEAGHLIAHSTIDFWMPHSFKSFAVIAQNSGTTASAGAVNTLVADNSTDTLTFGTDNKWITIRAVNDGTNDAIYFGHAASGATAGWYGLAISKRVGPTELEIQNHDYVNLDSNNTIEIPYFQVDNTGHISSVQTNHVIIPENFTTVLSANADVATALTGNTSSHTASNLVDSLTFKGANKWILVAADTSDNKKYMNFGHKLNGIGAQSNIGINTNLTPNFNTSFIVPYITFDEAGHITGIDTKTITLPQNSISGNKTNDDNASNVLTNLTLVQSTGALTRTFANVGSLKLTGFAAVANTANDLAVNDTINGAFAKLEARIKFEEANRATAISDAIGTEVTNRNSAISTALNLTASDVATGAVVNVKNAIAKAITDLKAYSDQSETDSNTYTDNKIGTLIQDTGNTTVGTAIATALATAKTYTDNQLIAKLGTMTWDSVYNTDASKTVGNAIATALAAANKHSDDLVGTLPLGSATVVAAIGAAQTAAQTYADGKIGDIQTLPYATSLPVASRSVVQSINYVNGRFASYALTSALNDYVAKSNFEQSVYDLLDNYDLTLKAPVIVANSCVVTSNSITVEIEEIAGTISYTYVSVSAGSGEDEVIETTLPNGSGLASNTYTPSQPLDPGNYRVIITRTYRGKTAVTKSEIQVLVE